MSELNRTIRIIRRNMPELRKKYRVRRIGVFGSYVRGEQRKRSDLDLLVDYYEVPSLFEFVSLQIYLSDLTGKKVDLVRQPSLRPSIRKRVLQEVVLA
jgi:uncharacterized protein